MIVKPIPFWDDGNPNYPLPKDYPTLSEEGKRQARVNGMRQWMLGYDAHARLVRGGPCNFYELTPGEKRRVMLRKGDAMVASVRLFNRMYLVPGHDEAGEKVWDPLFYGTTILPRPKFHDDGLRLHATNKYLAEVEPRGSAKTTDLRISCLMKMATRPAHDIVYTTASHPLAEITGDKIKYQLQENALLNDDFAPEYGGFFKPDRGASSWGITYFVARNRASFKISSVESVQRGLRPNDYVLDDPEWDPASSTDMQITRDEMDHLITRVIMPMVQHPGATLWWRGTFVSQRHFLWAAMEDQTVVGPDGKPLTEAVIEGFREWKRRIVDVLEETPEGLKSVWSHMWPTDEEEKRRLGLPEETRTLLQVEKAMTTPAFMAEMRGKPGTGGAAYFGKLTEREHGYWYDEDTIDTSITLRPTGSKAVLCWYRGDKLLKLPLHEFVRKYPTFITIDPAYTENATSDFKVVTCMAVSDTNELFVLDTWRSNKEPVNTMNQQAFQMAERWGSVAICPEKVKESHSAIAGLMEIVRTRASDVMGVTHLAQVKPIAVPTTIDKTSKIAALQYRFQYGKIKLPMKMRGSDKWRPLFNQIQDFNPHAAGGGLKKDDDLDTVCMSQFVVKLPRVLGAVQAPMEDSLVRWRRGEKTDKFGFPLIMSLPKEKLTEEDLKCLTQPVKPKSKSPPLV